MTGLQFYNIDALPIFNFFFSFSKMTIKDAAAILDYQKDIQKFRINKLAGFPIVFLYFVCFYCVFVDNNYDY